MISLKAKGFVDAGQAKVMNIEALDGNDGGLIHLHICTHCGYAITTASVMFWITVSSLVAFCVR